MKNWIDLIIALILIVISGYVSIYLIMFSIFLFQDIVNDLKNMKIKHVIDNGSRLTIIFDAKHKFIFNGEYDIIPFSDKLICINIAPCVDILVRFDENRITFIYEHQNINSVNISNKEAKIIKNFYNL